MVVKDFAAKSRWVRWLGRILIAHEHRAYRRLGPLEEIPVLLGRVDSHALALEMVRGGELTSAADRYWQGEAHLHRLRQAIDRFRARRFFHLDLRTRRNVLIRDDGGVVVLDLAAAIWFRPDSRIYRLAARGLSWYCEAVLLKWKALLTPQDLTAQDRRSLARFRILRGLWIFNLKGSWRRQTIGTPADADLATSKGDIVA